MERINHITSISFDVSLFQCLCWLIVPSSPFFSVIDTLRPCSSGAWPVSLIYCRRAREQQRAPCWSTTCRGTLLPLWFKMEYIQEFADCSQGPPHSDCRECAGAHSSKGDARTRSFWSPRRTFCSVCAITSACDVPICHVECTRHRYWIQGSCYYSGLF